MQLLGLMACFFPRSLLPVHLISSLAFPLGAGHLGTLVHISKDWASQSIFFTLEEELMGKRMGKVLQALGSLCSGSDPDLNLLCGLK